MLPVPPRQHDPWPRPATTLPATLVDATALLFDQGMADPRGGEYRRVGVVTGTSWDGPGVTDTHAWVMPAAAPSAQRFAVCWSGLVYPCVTVGGQADLAVDARDLLDADRKARDLWAKLKDQNVGPFRHRYDQGTAQAEPVAADSVTPLKTCLLLRAGETQLAESYWPAVADDARPHDDDGGGGRATPDDPYLTVSTDWAWYAFDRAVSAHMRGDDVVSRDKALLLTTALPKVESTDAAKKFERPTHAPNGNRTLVNAPYVAFAEQLPDLLADERRRVAEGPARRVLDDPRQYLD